MNIHYFGNLSFDSQQTENRMTKDVWGLKVERGRRS